MGVNHQNLKIANFGFMVFVFESHSPPPSRTHAQFYPSLVLVLPRKNRPYITERLLMGRKESNQTNKQNMQAILNSLRY